MADPQERNEEPDTTTAAQVGDDPTLVADRYRIVRTLGRGGGGHVWLATDEKLGRQVALKRVAGETDTDMLLNRGMREARTSATLAHEHVVRVYDAFEHEGSPWIVMEYVDGHSLAEITRDGAKLPVAHVASIGAQMATALAAAHRAGILHRDVKPANVLLTGEDGHDAKLTDFGIARAEEDPQLTRTGFVSGTAAYFSPELARGEEPSEASDVWALGATLYAAVEGERPFPERPNAVAQLHTIAREEIRPPQHAGDLTPVLAGMLDLDPTARWDAAHAARELRRVAAGGTVAGSGGATGSGVVAGVAGAAAVGAAAAAATRTPDATQAVPQADPTRTFTRSSPAAPAAAPAPVASPGTDQGYARTTSRSSAHPRGHRGGGRGAGFWLAWLVGIPLALLLGWLVWTIATGNDGGGGAADGTSPATAQVEATPVTADEGQKFVEDFYATLQSEGHDAARAMLAPDAVMATDIADDLQEITLSEVQATELDDGTAQVSAVVTYVYGITLVQDETLRVARTDDGLLIVTRQAVMRPTPSGDNNGDGDGGTDDGR